MLFGKIITILLLGYASWVFVTIACMGGIQGYRGYRRDRAKTLKQMKAARQSYLQQSNPQHSSITFNKIFG